MQTFILPMGGCYCRMILLGGYILYIFSLWTKLGQIIKTDRNRQLTIHWRKVIKQKKTNHVVFRYEASKFYRLKINSNFSNLLLEQPNNKLTNLLIEKVKTGPILKWATSMIIHPLRMRFYSCFPHKKLDQPFRHLCFKLQQNMEMLLAQYTPLQKF